jgi:hypothetical protein
MSLGLELLSEFLEGRLGGLTELDLAHEAGSHSQGSQQLPYLLFRFREQIKAVASPLLGPCPVGC